MNYHQKWGWFHKNDFKSNKEKETVKRQNETYQFLSDAIPNVQNNETKAQKMHNVHGILSTKKIDE